jgi:hypothetical protein
MVNRERRPAVVSENGLLRRPMNPSSGGLQAAQRLEGGRGAILATVHAGQITIVGFDSDQGTPWKAYAMAPWPAPLSSSPMNGGYQGMKDLARWSEGDKSFVPANGLIIVPTQILDKSNVDGFMPCLPPAKPGQFAAYCKRRRR